MKFHPLCPKGFNFVLARPHELIGLISDYDLQEHAETTSFTNLSELKALVPQLKEETYQLWHIQHDDEEGFSLGHRHDIVLSDNSEENFVSILESFKEGYFRWMYMNGDCWYFALAGKKLADCNIVAIQSSDERETPHVGVEWNGIYKDIRGDHFSANSFLGDYADADYVIRSMSTKDILRHLERWDLKLDADGFVQWEHPNDIAFDRQTCALFKMLNNDIFSQDLQYQCETGVGLTMSM